MCKTILGLHASKQEGTLVKEVPGPTGPEGQGGRVKQSSVYTPQTGRNFGQRGFRTDRSRKVRGCV